MSEESAVDTSKLEQQVDAACALIDKLRDYTERLEKAQEEATSALEAANDERPSTLIEGIRLLELSLNAEHERAERLMQERRERCSQHPADPLVFVCVECFESEKTAAATERATTAEAALLVCQQQFKRYARHLPNCLARPSWPIAPSKCSCGLAALLPESQS